MYDPNLPYFPLENGFMYKINVNKIITYLIINSDVII